METGDLSVCPVCDNTKWSRAYKIGQWNIDECMVCGFARIDPLPSRLCRAGHYSQEQVDKRNIKQRSSARRCSRAMKRLFSKLMKRNKNEIFYHKLSRYLGSGAKVLDVGCGDGSFLKLAKRQFVCTGIELSQYLAAKACRQAELKIITGEFLNTNITDRYEGITLISLLEHLDDPLQAIKKCFTLLKNKGILLIKTVNYSCLNRRIRKAAWTGFRPPDHIVYFSPANLKQLLKKAGFSKVAISAWACNDNMYCDAWK